MDNELLLTDKEIAYALDKQFGTDHERFIFVAKAQLAKVQKHRLHRPDREKIAERIWLRDYEPNYPYRHGWRVADPMIANICREKADRILAVISDTGEDVYTKGYVKAAGDSQEIIGKRELFWQHKVEEAKKQVAKEIFKAYGVYVKALEDENSSLIGLAYTHGWRSSQVEFGKNCRSKIKSLKSKYKWQALKGE